jgi:hypothetical protein
MKKTFISKHDNIRIYLIKAFRHSRLHWFLNSSVTNFLQKIIWASLYSKWIREQIYSKNASNIEVSRGGFAALFQCLIEEEKLHNVSIDYLEFGVAYGDTFNWWINFNKNPNSRFIGFDTFTGFPEKWAHFEKGDLSSEGKTPQINDNRHVFQKGLFQDTLPEWIRRFSLQQRTIINIDCDLYTSTLFVLTALASKLKKDDIIIFDDFNVRYPEHEFRAFYEFINAYKIRYKVICFSKVRGQFAIKLL